MSLSKTELHFLMDCLAKIQTAKSLEFAQGVASAAHILIGENPDIKPITVSIGACANKITAIKIIRNELNLGLREAKDLVESPSGVVYNGHNVEVAKKIMHRLNVEARATVRTNNTALQLLFGAK